MILSVPFYLCHFVRAILSAPVCPNTIFRIPLCPYHFVRYHFVQEPGRQTAEAVVAYVETDSKVEDQLSQGRNC